MFSKLGFYQFFTILQVDCCSKVIVNYFTNEEKKYILLNNIFQDTCQNVSSVK